MKHPVPAVGLLAGLALAPLTRSQAEVTFERLATEAADLDRLTRVSLPGYRNIQWSSTDRRSYAGPDSPDWFGNADGFGGEPVPGFAKTLREPDADGVGLWLLGEHRGPGAIVRTWTAGMAGTLRVYLDDEQPLWEGPAAPFLARRSLFLDGERDANTALGAFQMEDADHLPIPFAKSLRITWEGTLRELHFYQVQIRAYPAGTPVRTFSVEDLTEHEEDVATAARHLRFPDRQPPADSTRIRERMEVPARGRTGIEIDSPSPTGGQIERLALRVADAADRDAALRGTVLRLFFDGSRRPQVEAPLGDFFGSGPGLNPYESLPISVRPNGELICRFRMPFARSARLELEDYTGESCTVGVVAATTDYAWDERSMHFRARWRNSVGLDAGGRARPIDLPYVMLRGAAGRLVGAACMVVNPSGIPTPGGNWWGEGDEKVFVDDEVRPSILGTGSEDYFDYSWSRPRLFAHPYCGQPLDSGPGTAGFVSNHRFQILDDIPFDHSLWFAMELYTHRPLQDVDYARIAYCYARPGAVDDHVPPTVPELELPEIPIHEPVADGGAAGAVLLDAWDLDPRIGPHTVPLVDEPLATRHKVVGAKLEAGDALALTVPFASPGAWDLNVVGTHRPDGAVVAFWMDGQRLAVEGADSLALRTDHVTRVLSRKVSGPLREAGDATLEIRCIEPGFVGLDYLWLKRGLVVVPGMVEGETMQVTDHSDGLEWQRQGLRGDAWSRAEHLWIRGNEVGDFLDLVGTAPAPGRYRAQLVLTRSHDYAILKATVQGEVVGEEIDTFGRLSVMDPIDCGVIEIGDDRQLRVRLEIVGRNPGSEAPGTYVGIDGVVLERL